jgi:phosphoglycolate phosphatase
MPAHAFDAVLFDLDGTLADSAEDIRRALDLAFRDLGVPIENGVDRLVDGSPLEEIFAAAVPGGTTAELARFIEAYRYHYERAQHATTRLYPGVRETIGTLRSMQPRIKLAVATTKKASSAVSLIEILGMRDAFEWIGGSGATSMRPKPAPDLLLHVSEQLGVAPGRALMVGDTLRDVVAAQRAGMRIAAVTYGLGDVQALIDARPDYVLEEFDELLTVLGFEA